MSEHTHSESAEGILQESGGRGARPQRSFVGRMKKTALFFAPSLVVGLVAPFVFPALRRAIKPVAKGLIKGALELGESMREAAAQGREEVSDLVAEVRAEREQEATAQSARPNPSEPRQP
jgi:Protein of unknown function (DUF5132)